MKLCKISENCYYSTYDDLTDRPCLGYIKTSNTTAIMIDAGASKKHNYNFLNLLKEKHLPRPQICILTHSHWDHTFGINDSNSMYYFALKETVNKMVKENTELINIWKDIHESNSSSKISDYWSLTNEQRFCLDHMSVEYSNPYEIKQILPNVIIDAKNEIQLAYENATIKIFRFPYSLHSDDSLFIFNESEKVLYVGDGLYPNMNLDNVHDSKWLDTRLPIVQNMRTFIEDLDFNFCIAGHTTARTKQKVLDYIDNNYFII